MTARKPEEWRPVPGWPGYEASSMGRVRKVRMLAGTVMTIRGNGRQMQTTAGALYARAFGKAPLSDTSRVPRYKAGEFWSLTKTFLGTGSSLAEFKSYIIRCERLRFNLVTLDDAALRNRLDVMLRKYLKKGWVRRTARACYALTDLGRAAPSYNRRNEQCVTERNS